MPTGEGATTTTVVPGRAKREPGTHSPIAKCGATPGPRFCFNNTSLWLWAPAFAGATT